MNIETNIKIRTNIAININITKQISAYTDTRMN